MKPIIEKNDDIKRYYCPQCKKIIVSTKNMRSCGKKENYCSDCGQKIDWDGIVLDVYWPN